MFENGKRKKMLANPFDLEISLKYRSSLAISENSPTRHQEANFHPVSAAENKINRNRGYIVDGGEQ